MWYKAADNERIGPYRVIKHRITKELCLVGKYGEIWMYDENTCRAVITSAQVANRYLQPTVPCRRGDEAIITFPLSDVVLWATRLKVTRERSVMIKRANRF